MTRLILVPGLLCTDILFTPQMAALKDEAELVIADTFGMDSITGMAEKLLQENDGDLVVAGLSMGGYIALEAARLAPDRVRGLGLLSTAADKDNEKKTRMRKELIRLSSIGKFKGVTPRLLPQFLSPAALEDEALTQQVMMMAETVGQENFAYAASRHHGAARPDKRAKKLSPSCAGIMRYAGCINPAGKITGNGQPVTGCRAGIIARDRAFIHTGSPARLYRGYPASDKKG